MHREVRFAIVALGWAVLGCALVWPVRAAAAPAAQVAGVVRGAVAIAGDGLSRPLRRGSDLFTGDRIETGAGASVRIEFTDGTRFDLGASTSFRIDSYNDGNGVQDSFTTRLFKGAFRFVSGLIAKRSTSAMRLQLAVASVGIRGTSVAGEADATSATVMLLEPDEPDRPTAIDVSNAFGAVTIDQPGFGTEVPDASSPPSAPRRMQLRAVQNLIRSLQSIQRIRPPRPRIR